MLDDLMKEINMDKKKKVEANKNVNVNVPQVQTQKQTASKAKQEEDDIAKMLADLGWTNLFEFLSSIIFVNRLIFY